MYSKKQDIKHSIKHSKVFQSNFSQKLRALYIISFLINFIFAGISIYTYLTVTTTQNRVIEDHVLDITMLNDLELSLEKLVSKNRAYVITGNSYYLGETAQNRRQFVKNLELLKAHIKGAEGKILIAEIEQLANIHYTFVEKMVMMRKQSRPLSKIIPYFDNVVRPRKEAVSRAHDIALLYERKQFEDAKQEATHSTKRGIVFLLGSVVISMFTGIILFWLHTKTLRQKQEVDDNLTLAKEAAEAANLAKSSFLANMSHEIRTPLGAVLGFSELISDPQIQASERANFVSAIKRNGDLLSNIINDILDLSKIEAGKMKVETQKVGLNEILADTKTLLELQANEKGITLNVVVEKSTPEVIETDALRLRQILINIIGNAIKFTSKGSVDVSVRLKSAQAAQSALVPVPAPVSAPVPQLEFTIKDTGIGIDKDQIEKLFFPFSQADSTSKRKYGGTGLGLVLSKHFAKLLGGDVVLTQTSLNSGCTFTVTINPGLMTDGLTLIREGETKIIGLQNSHQPRPLEGVNILLAEDSPDNQMLISRLLRLAGATVNTAVNGKEAVEKANQVPHDVVLMDLQMPIMDGYEATAELRKSGYLGRIIALTAHTLSDDRERCLQSGFDEHVGKPVNRNILIERIKNLKALKT